MNEKAHTFLQPPPGISSKAQRLPVSRDAASNTPNTPSATVGSFQDTVPGGAPKPVLEALGLGKGRERGREG